MIITKTHQYEVFIVYQYPQSIALKINFAMQNEAILIMRIYQMSRTLDWSQAHLVSNFGKINYQC